jgi:ABC-type antimicrobial peptide transport system permease subunit
MVRSVVRRGAVLAGVGIVTGVIGALVLTRFMRALLFGVTPGDQATLIVVASVLGAVGLVAAWVPGRRATRIDPVAVLRGE